MAFVLGYRTAVASYDRNLRKNRDGRNSGLAEWFKGVTTVQVVRSSATYYTMTQGTTHQPIARIVVDRLLLPGVRFLKLLHFLP